MNLAQRQDPTPSKTIAHYPITALSQPHHQKTPPYFKLVLLTKERWSIWDNLLIAWVVFACESEQKKDEKTKQPKWNSFVKLNK